MFADLWPRSSHLQEKKKVEEEEEYKREGVREEKDKKIRKGNKGREKDAFYKQVGKLRFLAAEVQGPGPH